MSLRRCTVLEIWQFVSKLGTPRAVCFVALLWGFHQLLILIMSAMHMPLLSSDRFLSPPCNPTWFHISGATSMHMVKDECIVQGDLAGCGRRFLTQLNTCLCMIIIGVLSLPPALVFPIIGWQLCSAFSNGGKVLSHCKFHRGSYWPSRPRKYTTYNAKIASNPVGSIQLYSAGIKVPH